MVSGLAFHSSLILAHKLQYGTGIPSAKARCCPGYRKDSGYPAGFCEVICNLRCIGGVERSVLGRG